MSSEVEQSSPSVGCVKSKHQYLTVLQSQKSFEDCKSTSGESYVSSEVEHLSPSVGCARNKSKSHSSTESEIISVDAGLRMDGLRALDL